MERKDRLPIKNGMLERPRLNKIFTSALEYDLVTVVAGPGYGKTQALARFAQGIPGRLVWFHFEELDNNLQRFWRSLTKAVQYELPTLADYMQNASFPQSVEELDVFLRFFADLLYEGEQVVFIVDDYGDVTEPRVLHFFNTIQRVNYENFCLMLVSNRRGGLNADGMINAASLCSITTEDMRFDEDEVAHYLQAHHMQLSAAEQRSLMEETDGWPFALYHYVRQVEAMPRVQPVVSHLALAAEFFENNLFKNFTPQIQQLLVLFSQFPWFSVGIIQQMAPDNATEVMDEMGRNTFIVYDYIRGLFVFQAMYHRFLQLKHELVPKQELHRYCNLAANWFLDNGHVFEAIEGFHRADNYEGLVRSMAFIPKNRIPVSSSDTLLGYLNQIPTEWRLANPYTDLCRAYFYLNRADLNSAQAILLDLAGRIEADERPPMRQLLGEAHAVLGDISVQLNTTAFPTHYRLAAQLLPDGSAIHRDSVSYVDNNDIFFLPDDTPGSMQHITRLFFESSADHEVEAGPYGYGLEWQFAAEAAYYSADTDRALECAHKAIYKAGERGQWDIVCNAYLILMRIAVFYGDLAQVNEALNSVQLLSDTHAHPAITPIRDTMVTWYHLHIGNGKLVSNWVIQKAEEDEYPLTSARSRLLTAYSLYSDGQYRHAVVLLDKLLETALQRRIWTVRLTALILQAVCQHKLGEHTTALDTFHLAYLMGHNNSIVMPFVEFGNVMRTLVEAARRDAPERFDAAWLDDIYLKASSCAKRMASLASQYASDHRQQRSTGGTTLSKREQEVLNYLAQGQTREEIGELMGISVNGVKKHINGIYNKLGAINRADAIRIANLNGYL